MQRGYKLYQWRLKELRTFTLLTDPVESRRAGLPYLDLRDWVNVMPWSKLRFFLQPVASLAKILSFYDPARRSCPRLSPFSRTPRSEAKGLD